MKARAATLRRAGRCQRCRKNPCLRPDIFRARLEDIPDGEMLCIDPRICGDCLEQLGDECMAIAEEG